MSGQPRSRWIRWPIGLTVGSSVVIVQVALAVAAMRSAAVLVAVLFVPVLIMAVVLGRPALVAALAFPMSFIATRVGPAAFDLSLADATLVVAALAAVTQIGRLERRTRQLVGVGMIYLIMLSVNVIVVFNRFSFLELLHRSFLVVAAIVVGGVVATSGRTVFALRSLWAVAVTFAVAGMYTTAANDFIPAYVFGFHKNFIGPLIAMVMLVVVTAPQAIALPRFAALMSIVVLAGGLLATQSRASMLGLAAGLIVAVVREKRLRRYAVPVLVVVVGLGLFVFKSVEKATTGANDNRFNTVRSRQATYDYAVGLWQQHPLFGAGVRWFQYPGAGGGEPHSALFATLSEAGLWGIASILLLFGGACLVVRRDRSVLVTASLAIFAARIVEGQISIFWVAGTMTLPWLIAGLATGQTPVDADAAAAGDADDHLSGKTVPMTDRRPGLA